MCVYGKKTQPLHLQRLLKIVPKTSAGSAWGTGEALHNQSIALRKCDSQTDLIRLPRRSLPRVSFGSGPFHPGNGPARPCTGSYF